MAASSETDTVLVTGASGYIGLHVVLKLLKDTGYNVRGTVRDTTGDKAKSVRDAATALGEGFESRLKLVAADLLKPETWQSAVNGCTYVIHVASPVDTTATGMKEELLVKAAVDGTISILSACKETKGVKRVVITGSVASISSNVAFEYDKDKVFNENDWTDAERAYGYNKAKTLAEKAAWNFMEKLVGEDKFDLVVILPALVMGPVLSPITTSSMTLIQGMMSGKLPAVPKSKFPIIDVRDVAEGHIRALSNDDVCNKRIIMSSDALWFKEIAEVLQGEFNDKGYKVSNWQIPSGFLRFMGLFVSHIRKNAVPYLEKEINFDNRWMKELLGIEKPIDVKQSIIETAYSLIEYGQVEKKQTPSAANATAKKSCNE